MSVAAIHHYTNKTAYNAIRAQVDWCFLAGKPSARQHEIGAYFTDLGPATPNLAYRIRVPREKLEFVFSFINVGDLEPLKGQRGKHIYFSRVDYVVPKERQLYCGQREGQT